MIQRAGIYLPLMFRKKRTPGRSTGEPARATVTRDHVVWAYRLLLDREPENEDVIGPKRAGSRNTRELRNHLMSSAEFREKNPDAAATGVRTVVIKELDGHGSARLFIDLSDHVIGLGILRDEYEAEEIAVVRQQLRAGDVAVDVGAHIGYFAIRMAEAVGPSGRVFAFEPLAANAGLLERSVEENRFGDRVVVRRAAAGAVSGRASLTYPRETLNSGGAYLLDDGSAPPAGHMVAEVPVVALDDAELARPVRLMKIDAEGAEPQVIRGASRLIAGDRPVILSEVHPGQLARASGVTPDEYLAQLRALGYAARDLRGAALERAPADRILSVVFVPV